MAALVSEIGRSRRTFTLFERGLRVVFWRPLVEPALERLAKALAGESEVETRPPRLDLDDADIVAAAAVTTRVGFGLADGWQTLLPASPH
jgi:hypothetical protein